MTQLEELVRQSEVKAAAPPPSPPSADDDIDDIPLYAARRKIYPQSVHGTFRRIKWAVLLITLGIYYLLPFVRWDRGPNAPSQAVLIDFPNRRFYFFFIELWPQEVYYLTGLLILAAIGLFLMNALAGRVWCGYLCPQTVWTDLYMAIERFTEGDRREHMKRESQPWTLETYARKGAKHFLWLMVAWWTGGAWVLYFADAPTLVKDLATGNAPFVAYAWIGILTFTTYALAGHMREQVCLYMCPWPRIQAALTDEYALNVTYRYDRGEPRMSAKKAEQMKAHGERAGDCVDCLQCVHVCPTGIDIRQGSQLGCIQCGLCIDACDNIMAKLGRPTRLIAYDTDLNIKARQEGKPSTYRLIRWRTSLYAAIIAVAGGVMLYALATRGSEGISVIHDRNPMFVRLSDGSLRNGYTIRIVNKQLKSRDFIVAVEGLPSTLIDYVGLPPRADGRQLVSVGPDQTKEVRVLVTDYSQTPPAASTSILFSLIDIDSGAVAQVRDHFFGPERR
ncbi:cytochrome c oxidase accessory protein CcoG [Pseudolabrys sp. FHR47]|uniref:cytochrome c oxidase accessory protein CcoG n=1 Tax=Pseudolabrys sp. FHR47 TaxID=2562284 RepID=UPI0010BEFAA3|nr:cytochrome c oxidase accessory protein CcoG [Pseudolabrys sp. FHR47]